MKTIWGLSVGVLILLFGCVPADSVRPGVSSSGADVGSAGSSSSHGPKSDPAGYEGELTVTEQRLREQARKLNRTVWEGALIGALAATAGRTAVKVRPIPFGLVVVGRRVQEPLGDAAAGAGLGALAGAYVAEKQKRYADAEDQLDAMISDARGYNETTQALIAYAQMVLAEDRRRLEAIEARLRQGQATEAELARERARVLANRKVVDDAAAGARDQHEMFAAARRNFAEKNPGTPTRSMEQELEAYRRNIAQLDEVAQRMTQA